MSETWYKVRRPRYGLAAVHYGKKESAADLIAPVEVDRSTDKMLYIGGRRTTKRSDSECYFETLEDAKEFLLERLRVRLEHENNSAIKAHEDLSLACELLGEDEDEYDGEVNPIEDTFLIFSESHSPATHPGGCALFFGPKNSGYYAEIDRAGHYSAQEILADKAYYCNKENKPVRLLDVAMLSKTVADAAEVRALAEDTEVE